MPEENKEKTQKKRWTLKKVKTRCRTIYWQNTTFLKIRISL